MTVVEKILIGENVSDDVLLNIFKEKDWIRICEHLRWKGKSTCPTCQKQNSIEIKRIDENLPQYRCVKCAREYNVFTDTIFAKKQILFHLYVPLIREVMMGIHDTVDNNEESPITKKARWWIKHLVTIEHDRNLTTLQEQIRHLLHKKTARHQIPSDVSIKKVEEKKKDEEKEQSISDIMKEIKERNSKPYVFRTYP